MLCFTTRSFPFFWSIYREVFDQRRWQLRSRVVVVGGGIGLLLFQVVLLSSLYCFAIVLVNSLWFIILVSWFIFEKQGFTYFSPSELLYFTCFSNTCSYSPFKNFVLLYSTHLPMLISIFIACKKREKNLSAKCHFQRMINNIINCLWKFM